VTIITVGEIARRVKEPGEDESVVIDRLRSWTKEGLLTLANERNPGTGRKRHYDERAIVEAAILSKLSRYFGIWAPRVNLFSMDGKPIGVLQLAAEELTTVKEVSAKGKIIYLLAAILPKSRSEAARSDTLMEIMHVDEKKSLEYAISNRDLPRKAWRPHCTIPLPVLLDTGLIINLTRLFQKLRVPIKDYDDG
jgi:hypothetical protein